MSYLTKALDRANDFSTRTTNLARAVVTKMSAVQEFFASGGGEAGGDPLHPESYSTAAAQYRANRGWVFAATDLLASRVSAQQVYVASDRVASGGAKPNTTKAMGDDREPLESHPLLDLLATPNQLMTGCDLLYATVASIALTGRQLWWVDQTEGGGKTILPIPTSWIQSVDNARRVWKIKIPEHRRPEGMPQELPIPGENTVLIQKQDPADPWGFVSTLAAISEAVATDAKIADAQWRIFEQGHWPQFALVAGKMPAANGMAPQRPHLTPDQRKQLTDSIRRAYQGSHRMGEPLILDGLIENVIKLSLTPSELDFLNSGKVTKARILQAFRCSPILLGEVEGANRASATVADMIFCSATVNPMIGLISRALTRYLGPMFANDGEVLTVWLSKAEANDDEMTLRRWQYASAKEYVTPDEFRKHILNLPPREPEEKDESLQDVQAQAMNGAQIQSLVQIAQSVGEGTLSRDAARAIIAASFPLLSDEKVDAIVNALEEGTSAKMSPAMKSLIARINPYTLKTMQ